MKTAIGTALACCLLVGCSAPGQTQQSAASDEPTAPSTIENCDVAVEVAPAPERVVTVKSTPLELMLALGLEDRIVGSAFLDGPVPASLAPSGWNVNEISDKVPGRELLLSTQPDFVFAGWASNLTADGPGTRSELEGLGIRSYVSPAACDFGEATPQTLTFDGVFEMYRQIGTIFEVPDRAETLIASQQEELAKIATPKQPLSALWFSSGDDTPFVGGGTGAPNMIMEAAGLTNVVADQEASWASLSWEAFVASDPDVIILVDSPWNSAAAKRERLESHPAAQTMRAVQAGHYIVVDFATTEAGVRNVEAVATISEKAIEIESETPGS